MLKYILLCFFSGWFFSFIPAAHHSLQAPIANLTQDTVPVKMSEKLIQQLNDGLNEKTWRDSGYYFQLERVFWTAKRLGVSGNGDGVILTTFSSSDPSSLMYRGEAVFRFPIEKWPADISPTKGMKGEAVIAFPQDVLYCPSPSEEIGLGQNDPYFPLFLTGYITGVEEDGDLRYFELGVSVQLRDLDIIL